MTPTGRFSPPLSQRCYIPVGVVFGRMSMSHLFRQSATSATLAVALLFLFSLTSYSQAQTKSTSKKNDADLMRRIERISETGGSAEQRLRQFERLYEEVPADQETLCIIREKFAQLRPLVKPNVNKARAGVWKVRAFIIRSTDFKWVENDVSREYQASFNEDEIERIKRGLKGFEDFVWKFSDGWLRINWTCEVVDATLTKFDAIGDRYWSGPSATMDILPNIPKNSVDTIMTFVKTGGDNVPKAKNDPIPLYCFGAAIGEWDPQIRGATYITFHWATDSAVTEPDGEPMMHEWLHSLQWALENRLGYPEGLAGNPDGGRLIGEERDVENADPCYRRDPEKEKSWIDFYRHILQTHTTRKMLREASSRKARKK